MSDRVNLMGVSIDRVGEVDIVRNIIDHCARGQGGWVVTANLDQLRQIVHSDDLRALVAKADVVVADGMPLVWASWLQGTPLPERVAGSDLIFSLTKEAAHLGASLCLLGGNEGTAEKTADVMRREYPGARIVGTLCPPRGFDDDEANLRQLEATLIDLAPDIVYVCLGFPKQERLIGRLRRMLPNAWFLGLGISFSFVSGEITRAPVWMQHTGLEWLHRMAQEPRRLFGRYVLKGLPFATRLLVHSVGVRLSKKA